MENRLRHIAVLVLLFLMNGCAVNQFFLSDEIDKVNVVKYTPYVKHYRAYFARTRLRPVIKHRKYLFLYSPQKQTLLLLLYRDRHYLLYNFTKPENSVLKLKSKGKLSEKSLLKSLSKRGYHIANLTRLGYDAKVGLRRYKGVKTLMIEVKNYAKLKRLYESAIKHYQAKNILSIQTQLPKKFINSYFLYYYKRAKTTAQKRELRRIAKKLHIMVPIGKERTRHKVPIVHRRKSNPVIKQAKTPEAEVSEPEETYETDIEQSTVNYPDPVPTTKPYLYYLRYASLYELSNYLDDPQSHQDLSLSHYHMLQHRLANLKEEQLLRDGSLEALIAAYKKDKNPKFKQRILQLLKKKQEEDAGR